MKKTIITLLLAGTTICHAQISNHGAYFDGVNDMVMAQPTSLFAFGTGDFTIEAWMRNIAPNTVLNEQQIIANYPMVGGGGFRFCINGGGPVLFVNGVGVGAGGSDLRDSQCHHVAVKRLSGSTYFYVDGVLSGSGGWQGDAITAMDNIVIGGYLGNLPFYNSFHGLLKEVRVWNVALTNTQIQSNLYSNVTGASGLVGYWRFNEGSGNFANDYAAANTGTFGNPSIPSSSPIWSTGCSNCIPPTATITPSGNLNFCTGPGITLQANIGTGLTYQWRKNSVNIAGATNSSYLANSTGTFNVVVTNSSGCSKGATPVNVTSPPSVIINPSGPLNFCTGGNVVLTASSGQTVSYQWRKNGANIAGATSSSYIATSTGSYNCVVTNSFGCSKGGIPIAVTGPPSAVITANGPTTFCAGGSVQLSAQIGYTYQWIKNSANIAGATSQTYIATTAGNYKVKVTNQFGCSKTTPNSNQITVTVPCREGFFGDDENNVEPKGDNVIKVLPNPTYGKLKLETGGLKLEGVTVYDISGRKVFTAQFKNTKETNVYDIDLSGWVNGVYFMQVNTLREGKTVKVVKQ